MQEAGIHADMKHLRLLWVVVAVVVHSMAMAVAMRVVARVAARGYW